MQTGLAGLVVWSFVMASAYGAGLTVIPTLQPICASAAAVQATAGTPSTCPSSGSRRGGSATSQK